MLNPLLIYFAIGGNISIFVSAFIFYHAEKGSNEKIINFTDSLWWAITTVTTVGYGDIAPVTDLGRLISAFLMIAGVFCFVCSTAVLVAAIVPHAPEGTFHEAPHEKNIKNLQLKMSQLEKKIEELAKKISHD